MRRRKAPSFTIGVEEEYLLVDLSPLPGGSEPLAGHALRL